MSIVEQLQQELAGLREQVRRLTEKVEAPSAAAEAPRGELTRRNLLRAAPIAAVGGAVMAISIKPAAAAPGEPVLQGQVNDEGAGVTTTIRGGSTSAYNPALSYSGGLTGDWLHVGYVLTDLDAALVVEAAAVAARFDGGYTASGHSLYGSDSVRVHASGPGTVVSVDASDGFSAGGPEVTWYPCTGLRVRTERGQALDASSDETAVAVVSTSATTPRDAVTIDYQGSSRAFYAQSHNTSNINGTVTGVNEGRGIGVWGELRGDSRPGIGVVGVAGALGRGAQFQGGAAAVRLVPSAASTHPTTGKVGDLVVDRTARLWFCTKASSGTTAAVWKQIA